MILRRKRYDGSGFPNGLKGTDIPEAARIIAIAESYDSMTTRNSYREPLPQSVVREEFIKESGYKYDPLYTGIMLQLIDSDVDYQMKEETENVDTIFKNEFTCDEYRSAISYGIRIRPEKKIIAFSATPLNEDEPFSSPAIIVFDSMDERVHDTDKAIKDTRYVEFGEIWFDGHFVCSGARNIKLISLEKIEQDEDETYFMEIARNRDHVQLKLEGKGYRSEVVLALPDSSKYAYIGLTGENCHISSIEVEKTNKRADTVMKMCICRSMNHVIYPSEKYISIRHRNEIIITWETHLTKTRILIQLLLYQIICYKCVSKSYLFKNSLIIFVNFYESLYFTLFININNSVCRKKR